jgi:hypothetical protein
MGRPRKVVAGGRIYVATDNFATELSDGTPVIVQQGITRVREGHELLQGRESMFEEMKIDYDVEQATAEPGERRGE